MIEIFPTRHRIDKGAAPIAEKIVLEIRPPLTHPGGKSNQLTVRYTSLDLENGGVSSAGQSVRYGRLSRPAVLRLEN